MESFAQRAIDVTITIGKGQYGEKPGDPVVLTGYRVFASTEIYATQTQGILNCLIYGLPLTLVNQLTQMGTVGTNVKHNAISVSAGSYDMPTKSVVYEGEIWTAYGDFSGMPDVPLVVQAQSGVVNAVKPVNPTSYKGSADAATVMQALATQMGYSFKNDGVSVKLSNPYFSGTAMDQLKSCARAAGALFVIENNVLTIWPKNGARSLAAIAVSPDTGLVGYPTFTSYGIAITTLFNPNFRLGGKVTLQSSLTPACGTWTIYKLSHSLASETPNGPWFSQLLLSTMETSNG